MSAGLADLVIEQGADWALQIFWTNEATGAPIKAQGPMDMDIINPRTGQRLIRLDDGGTTGGNGGISSGGSGSGVIQLGIDDAATTLFAPGQYRYDLFVYSSGPPLQRMRLLAGGVSVVAQVTDLGSSAMQGGWVSTAVPPPDIVFNVSAAGVFTLDPNKPTNMYSSLENGVPLRAGLIGTPSIPGASLAVYNNASTAVQGPVADPAQVQITGTTLNSWLQAGAILTLFYRRQTDGLVVTKIETVPGGAPSPVA
jgi:hypothetical protein